MSPDTFAHASGSAKTTPKQHRAVSVLAILLALVLLSLPALASMPPSGPANGKAGQLRAAGAFSSMPSDSKETIRQVARGTFAPEPADGPALIRLEGGLEFDPNSTTIESLIPASLRGVAPTGSDRGFFIVQFGGPISQDDRALVESQGGTILGYIPDYALLVSMSGDARSRIDAQGRVAWSGLYEPAYKISKDRRMSGTGTLEMDILVFQTESIDEVSSAIAAAGGRILEARDNGINKIIRAEIDRADVAAIARIPGVAWIEPLKQPVFYNDQCQWVIQTWSPSNRHIWDMGIRGEGQVVSLSDSGIRTTHRQFKDNAVSITTFGDYPTHRKVIGYKKTVETTSITFGDESLNSYHGTHTSCTIAGDDSPFATDARDGMALKAKIYFLDGGGTTSSGVFSPADLNDMFIIAYNGNAGGAARIITNSWGDPAGTYDLHAMTTDQFMWLHPDFLPFFSNGNNGTPGSVGSPAVAKNVVSAGGTNNGTSAGTLFSLTSRGPTDDGRLKPTICAPATLASANGSGDTGYITLSGTSMSSPAMAGGTALIRQYLTDGWYPTGAAVPANGIPDPSAALMKAMAINSADPLSGYNIPSMDIGWGRLDLENVLYFTGDARRLALIDFTDGLWTGEYVEFQVQVASSLIPLKAALVWTDYPGALAAGVELVNNLNLTANDGTTTYKGNVYSSGQSAAGGSADNLNVEECVQRNTPATGVWTFRIEASNVPFGPQPFALVITGGLASDAAVVQLDRPTYGGTDNVLIRVNDNDAGGSITVTATSTTEPSSENVVLSGSNGVYQGTLPLSMAGAVSGNGALSVSNGDQITVTYNDSSPVATLTAKAMVDITGPTITNVRATTINENDATIAWTTNVPANAKVYYGPTSALGSSTMATGAYMTSQSSLVSGLLTDQTYCYDVESTDNQGNAVRDDNGGLHYTFTTDRKRDVLLVIGDSTFDKTVRYQNAFARTGWTYSIWEGAQSATPFVGDQTAGLASYKAVVWQPGLEQYPVFTDAARDSIAKLNLLGSRLAVYSNDVAWDFSDPTSPDYTAARLAWFNSELHATWQVDPASITQMKGYAGDPISGAYTAGISYTAHRDGAAGDEVNGIAGTGTFANVWKDNTVPGDDVAIRWTSNGAVGNPLLSVWGGTPNKCSSNFFEWAHLNNATVDDVTRADVLDKMLIWLVGRDHPSVDLTAPVGGETFTGATASISWTESAAAGFSIATRKIYTSSDSGNTWNLITASPGTSPYSWDLSAVPNGLQYRIRIVLEDNGTPVLNGSDASGADFTINRTGGDTRGPVVVGGSITVSPNPIVKPNSVALAATLTDVMTGNSNIAAAEWSSGVSPAPAGTGNAMSGTFASPIVAVTGTVDSQVLATGTDQIWVRGKDAANVWGNATPLVVVVNGSAADVADGLTPARFALHANAPNPFGPLTTIRFDLPRPSPVRLAVFDIAGRKVRTLVDETLPAGSRSVIWDGRDGTGNPAASGIYFYRFEAGSYSETKKMTLLK
jgi:hypothetical protein